jgi:hypothetical protein
MSCALVLGALGGALLARAAAKKEILASRARAMETCVWTS